MNRTEQAFRDQLEHWKASGVILAYWFEAFKFKIASEKCYYTPDFVALMGDSTLAVFEVKGSLRIFTDDAKVKCKVFADQYPLPLYVVCPKGKGVWGITSMSETGPDTCLAKNLKAAALRAE